VESRRIRNLEALTRLCRELARLGLTVGISDARPALSVRAGAAGSKVWITVNPSGQLFTWQPNNVDRHPVEDPAGAAAHIFDYIKIREHDDGGESS
jgi:hypothetical protein